jgi:hypothetical protein
LCNPGFAGDISQPKANPMSENNSKYAHLLTDPIFTSAVALLQGKLSGGVSPAMFNTGTHSVDDSLLEDALHTAEVLADMAQGGPSDVNAYQLFKEGEQLGAETIAMRFKEAGWKSLTAPNTVRDLMEAIRSWHDGYVTLPLKSVSARVHSADVLLRGIISELIPRMDRNHPQSDVVVAQLAGELAGELSKLHVRWRTTELKSSARELPSVPPMPHECRTWEANWSEMSFFAWCYEDRQQGNTTRHYFRPYEIFANALSGFPSKGRLILAKGLRWKHLVSPRRDPLAQGFPVFENTLGVSEMIWDAGVNLNEFCSRYWKAINGHAVDACAEVESEEDAPVGKDAPPRPRAMTTKQTSQIKKKTADKARGRKSSK